MVSNYDPGLVYVSFLGQILSGYADGTFITAERNEDAFMLMVGADGETLRARNRNRSGKITLTLMQSSTSNDLLSNAAIDDELGVPGAIGPLFIKDGNGRTLIRCQTAWVSKLANAEFAKEGTPREWVLETDNLNLYVGGSNLL
jgi:hypothetical protein